MNTSTISWVLSALSYDENHVADYVTTLFPGFSCHFKGSDDGAHFYGVVIDPKIGRTWWVNRGTDGYDGKGNFKSWLYDLNIIKGADGIHNGFQKLGNDAFNEIKPYLYDADQIFVTGHSQGAGVSPYGARLCVENLDWIKHIHFDSFAPPPTGNSVFADSLKPYFESGKLSGDNYKIKKDPVCSDVFRDTDSFFLDGVDVGTQINLPAPFNYPVGPLYHSCWIYNLCMMLSYAQMGHTHIDDYHLLGKIHNWIVN